MQVRRVPDTPRVAAPFASSVRSSTSGFELPRLTVDGDGVECIAKSSSGGDFLADEFLGAGMV